MKRRLSFATPFVLTIACGGSRPDPTEVRDPEPMRDIAQPEYELAPDAAVADAAIVAITADAALIEAPEPTAQAPLCYVVANPPGYRSCPAHQIVKVEIVGTGQRLTFGVGRDHGYKPGMKVVLGKAMQSTTIDRCEMTTCTATVRGSIELDNATRVVWVVTTR